MNNEQNTAGLRVALASYDTRVLRVQKRYLEEQDASIVCCGYQSGRALLDELEQKDCFDIIVLDSQLEDMEELEFISHLRQLACKPLLLLSGKGRSRESAGACPHPDGGCYALRPVDLK